MITFSDKTIIDFCDESSYKKGHDCASFDYFIKTFVQERVLFGLYQGSVGTYRVNIIFNSDSIPEYAWCTCPAMGQYDDYCKHVAGLMILWTKHSKEFMPLESWQSLLKNKDKDELFKLIVTTASKSIDMTHALYEELCDISLLDYDEIYDPEEW